MKRFSLLILFFIPLILFSQIDSTKGINWSDALSFQHIIDKAKKENKHIFIDCYATWCGPCKAMDKEVFSDTIVGSLLNEKFISVKVQMDKTDRDNDVVKMWYAEAKKIQTDFSVVSYPTFLFLSPEGVPIHKGIGYRNKKQFIVLLKDVFEPHKQYFHVLSKFEYNNYETEKLKEMAAYFKELDKDLSGRIAAKYLSTLSHKELYREEIIRFIAAFKENISIRNMGIGYIKRLKNEEVIKPVNMDLIKEFSDSKSVRKLLKKYLKSLDIQEYRKEPNRSLLQIFKEYDYAKAIAREYFRSVPFSELIIKENIVFLNEFTESSKDLGFKIFYSYGKEIDKVVKDDDNYPNNYSQSVIDNIIKTEEILRYCNKAVENGNADHVPWDKIKKRITNKYDDDYAQRTLLQAKCALYSYFANKYNRNWDKYFHCNLQLIERYGIDTTKNTQQMLYLNNLAWDIFSHSDEPLLIRKAIIWMEDLIKRHNREDVCIDTYANLLYKSNRVEEAIEWEKKALSIAMEKNSEHSIKAYKVVINRMEERIPTWFSK